MKFISPEDISTTVVVCEICGWQQDTGTPFLTLADCMMIADGHIRSVHVVNEDGLQ